MNNGNAPFFHGDQGLIRPQGYRPDHLEQARRENPGPAQNTNGYFPPIPYRRPAQQDLMPGWNNQGHLDHRQQVPGGLHVGDPHFPNHLGSWQQPRLADWDNRRFQGRHEQDRAGFNLGNSALVNRQDFQGQDLTAPDFDIEEEVPYEDPVILNTQQQSTSGGPRIGGEPVADISAHSKEDQQLLMSVYGDRFNFSSSVPGAAPQAVSPVAVAIPPPAVTPGPRQGPSSGSDGSMVSLTRGSPNEVTPSAPAAPRAMAPPGFFPPAPNTPHFMTPPPQFNMQAGGNFWNPGMHPMDHMAMLLRESIAKNKRLEEELATLKRQFGVQSNAPLGKKRRQEEPTTSAKIKEEPADDEEVDHGSSASRTIKKEPLDPRSIQPILQPAPNADLVVLAEIRPEIRRYKTIAEAVDAAEKEFSAEYFSAKFGRFNLPNVTSYSELFGEFLFKPQHLTSLGQLPQLVRKRCTYGKTLFEAVFPGAPGSSEDYAEWKKISKELEKVQMDQRRAGLIRWKESRSTGKRE